MLAYRTVNIGNVIAATQVVRVEIVLLGFGRLVYKCRYGDKAC